MLQIVTPATITHDDLSCLAKAAMWDYTGNTVQGWLSAFWHKQLIIVRFPGGLIGLRRIEHFGEPTLWVEFVAGQGAFKRLEELKSSMLKLATMVGIKRISWETRRPGIARLWNMRPVAQVFTLEVPNGREEQFTDTDRSEQQ